jgi:SynChlorMet cassette protein ScmD
MNKNLTTNPLIVLREEFDDWAVLFNPDTGDAYGLNPLGVFIWKQLNGKNSFDQILEKIKEKCRDVPAEAEDHLEKFVQQLTKKGMVGSEISAN